MINIIAEAGINHDGDMYLAREMVLAAKTAGADIIKFQMFKDLPGLSSYELTFEEFSELKELCVATDIEFMCTPFCEYTLENVIKLVKQIKLSSRHFRDKSIIRKAVSSGKTIILSCGMNDRNERMEMIHYLKSVYKYAPICIMHCQSIYPIETDVIRLGDIKILKSIINKNWGIGLSDHSMDIYKVPVCAVAVGVDLYEKHFTLKKGAPGADHNSSISCAELSIMIDNIREAEKLMRESKSLHPEEIKLRNNLGL